MGTFLCFFLLMMFQRVHLHDHRFDWLDTFVRQTSSHFKYSQIITFINKSDGFDMELRNSIIERLMREIPLLFVDLHTLIGYGENKMFKLNVFKYPRSTALYMILLNEDESTAVHEAVKNTLELITRLSPVPTRPRCLVVLFNNDNNVSGAEYGTMKEILLTAWALKFLDLAISEVSKGNKTQKIMLHHYNPFRRTFHSEDFNNGSIIFPDKLANMNQHPFNVPVYHYPSLMRLKKENREDKPQIDEFENTYLYIFSKKLNFSPRLHLQKLVPADPTFFQMIFKLFRTGELNMMATQFLVGANLFNNSVVLGKMHSQTRFTIIAPVLPIEKTNLTSDIFIYLALFPLIVIIYATTVRVMRLHNGELRIECISRILLGVPKKKMPRRLTTRVIYLNLLLLSVKYSSDAFSKLTDVKCIKGDRSFDTPEDILKQGFYVYIPPFVQKQFYIDTTEFMRMIEPRLRIMSHVECTKKLIKNKDRFCFAPDPTSQFLVDTAYAKYKKRIIKLTKATDLSDYSAFTYEKGSPYVEKFDSIMQRLIEAGIEECYTKQGRCKFRMEEEEKEGEEQQKEGEDRKTKDLLASQLYVLLTFCYAVCILVFIREVLETPKKSQVTPYRQSMKLKLPIHKMI